jgi:hypothetical protein
MGLAVLFLLLALADAAPASIAIEQMEDATPGLVRLEAAGPGFASVDRGPWRPLPLAIPADGRTRDVVVLLDGVVTAFRLPFLAQTARFVVRPATGPELRIETPRDVDLQVEVDGAVQASRPLAAGEAWQARLPAATQSVKVTCRADGHAPWEQTVALGTPRDVRITCDPAPLQSVVFLRTDAPETRFLVGTMQVPDLRECPVEAGCPERVPAFGPQAPPPATTWASPDRWYVTRRLGPDVHRLCAAAPGRRLTCVDLDTGATHGPAALQFQLLRETADDRPAPREVAAAWSPGPLDVFAAGGASWKHRRTFADVGAGLRLTPRWSAPCLRPDTTRCLAFEVSLSLEQAEEPVFLRRWEAETRLAIARFDARWSPWRWTPGRVALDPVVALGAFVEPDVAVGPWIGAGLHVDLGVLRVTPSFGLPVFVADRLGHVGYEALVAAAVGLPLGEAP